MNFNPVSFCWACHLGGWSDPLDHCRDFRLILRVDTYTDIISCRLDTYDIRTIML